MRVALHATSEVGMRAGRILLAERDLEYLGLVDRTPKQDDDPRLVAVTDLADFDVLASDDVADPGAMVEEALDARINVVLWTDDLADAESYHDEFARLLRSLVPGANLASGIAPALAHHETARAGTTLGVRIAWTEPGAPLRRGEAIPFPDPVGARWGKLRHREGNTEHYVVPVAGKWAAAMARVTGSAGDGVITRVVGVADLAPHLEAIALAAGVNAAGHDAYPPGLTTAPAAGERYLSSALNAGLEVAAFTLEGAE